MRVKLFKNPYKKALRESASLIAPSDEVARKILGTVMLAAGVSSVVSFAAASTKVAALGKMATIKAMGSAVAVTVGVSVAGVSAYLPPAIKDLRVDAPDYTQASIVITTDNPLNIRTVRVIPEQGAPIAAVHDDFLQYVAPVYQNGAYTVEVTGQSGQTVIEQVQVQSFDTQIPTMERYQVDAGGVTVFFTDDLSGINWENFTARSESGAVVEPLELNAAQNYVRYPIPTESLTLFVEDQSGNRASTTIYVSWLLDSGVQA